MYVKGVKYSFIGLAIVRSSAIVIGGVLCLRIPSGSRLKEVKSGFLDIRPSIHQVDFF